MENPPSVRNPSTIKAATPRVLYLLLLIYAGIAGTYQVVNAVSTMIGNFNLRNQVQAPFQLYGNLISSPAAAAVHTGLAMGDGVLAINQLRFTGQALWQRIRWYARPSDTITVLVRKQTEPHLLRRFLSRVIRRAGQWRTRQSGPRYREQFLS